MKKLRNQVALVLLLVFAAAACGGASSSSESASSLEGESAEADTPTQEPETEGSTDPKTLDEYLGLAANVGRGGQGGPGAGAGGGFDQDQALEQQRLVQQGIQVCMKEQGFTYVPEEVGDGLQFFVRSERSTLSAAEYAETQGFGISTGFDAILDGEFDVSDADSPNDEHLATLSDGEADAWQLALRGAPPERNEQGQLIDAETGEVIQGARGRVQGGCTGEAQEAVRGDLSLLAELTDEFAELNERITSDPRIAEIQREWVDCMRGAGFDYQAESEARAEINQEFRPLLRSFFQGTDNAGQGGGGGGRGGNQLEAVAGLVLTADQELELEAMQDRERAVAIASVECQGDSAAEIAEITERYEAEFVEVNRDVLESIG